MKRKKNGFFIAIFLLFAVTGLANADEPVINIDSVIHSGNVTYPQSFEITVTISHVQNHLNSLKDLIFTVDGDTTYYNAKPYTGSDIRTSATFSLTLSIPEPGIHTINVIAYHGMFRGFATQTITAYKAQSPL